MNLLWIVFCFVIYQENPQAKLDFARIKPAVDRGLLYLAQQQQLELDGSLPGGNAAKHAPVGITALAALAFMASGNTAQGPYANHTAHAIEYLLAHADPNSGYISADQDAHSKMHGHGYATLALAEAYGWYGERTGKEGMQRLRTALEKAVALIEQSQGDSGGWFYTPERSLSHEGSITITLVQALRAARNVGILVNPSTINQAVEYVRKLQKDDGSFRYQLGKEDSTAALTAAAITTLTASGEYYDAAIDRAVDFLQRFQQQELYTQNSRLLEPFPDYGRLYTAQAYYQNRDHRFWDEWFARTSAQLIAEQKSDGSWNSHSPFGVNYTTTVNCIVLAMPFDYLPIFQR